jgi:ANTAR domain
VTSLGPGGFPRVHAGRLEATWRESRALGLPAAQAIARARATREQILQGRSQREILHESAFARLQAQMGTIAVIEQAKGIIMAQQRCGPEEAFGVLRRTSQRANVKVHVLAARMVEQAACGDHGGNVTPISPGATRRLRP